MYKRIIPVDAVENVAPANGSMVLFFMMLSGTHELNPTKDGFDR